MTPPFRDDCPPEYSLFRRRFLGAGIATVGFAAAPLSLAALANTVPAMPAAKFLEVSSQLINHQLNAELGGRLGAAMAAADPAFEQKIDSILTIAKTNNAKIVEDFYPEIPPGKRQDAALAIVSAWYSGVLSEGARIGGLCLRAGAHVSTNK